MTVKQLRANMMHPEFNIERELQITKYIPVEVKIRMAQTIIDECTTEQTGCVKLDTMKKHMEYIKAVINMYTNLEYNDTTYDALMSTMIEDAPIITHILSAVGHDAQEFKNVLDIMLGDYMRNSSLDGMMCRLIGSIEQGAVQIMDVIKNKIDSTDLDNMLPKDLDLGALETFLNLVE